MMTLETLQRSELEALPKTICRMTHSSLPFRAILRCSLNRWVTFRQFNFVIPHFKEHFIQCDSEVLVHFLCFALADLQFKTVFLPWPITCIATLLWKILVLPKLFVASSTIMMVTYYSLCSRSLTLIGNNNNYCYTNYFHAITHVRKRSWL